MFHLLSEEWQEQTISKGGQWDSLGGKGWDWDSGRKLKDSGFDGMVSFVILKWFYPCGRDTQEGGLSLLSLPPLFP